ncbi:MAG TPA: hypothetical protein VM911_23085 [Pyrinomonadaceae bacterium]|nr:hypothetical protein [Pyrinomonadaceae bacterium]
MSTKKSKSTKKATKSTRQTTSREEEPVQQAMRAALAQAEQPNASIFCQRLDAAANDFLNKSCAGKQFDQTAGNCNNKSCQTVEEPKIEPCVHLRWGDGPQDQLETEDTEILCITICNPYSNVALNDFTAYILVLNADGTPVANLPDGTPSVLIKPNLMICFDDIPPCDPQNPRKSCVSREVVLLTRGAKVGTYLIAVLYCFQACFTKLGAGVIRVNLVAS